MLADPNDEAVSYVSQKEFADRANEKAVPIRFMNAKGRGKQQHGTSAEGIRTATRCLAGIDDNEIAAKVAEAASVRTQTAEDSSQK